jgi:PAS domain S-box-containing protein
MPDSIVRRIRVGRPARWTAAFLICLAWLAVVALAVARLRQADGVIVAFTGLAASAVTFGIVAWVDRARWRQPIKAMTQRIRDLRRNARPRQPDESESEAEPEPELAELTLEIAALAKALRSRPPTRRTAAPPASRSAPDPQSMPSQASLTRSGLFDAPPARDVRPERDNDPTMSGDYSTADMVNRLDPVGFRWIESSTAEQVLLGWELTELRQKSFLDVLHPDDRPRALETFSQALTRGEALGLVVRVRTAHGSTRAIEVNVGARYGTNQKVTHLRCHLTDVTDKVRAERELKLRSLELTQVNEQLRRINRELEELKDTLSQRNRELDEFVYVVSHDLQEPLRTLIAFSDFLLRDYGEKLEAEGQEFVRYLVDASRRMRSMIHGMLNLARVGKVIGENTLVNLDELLAVIKTDLGELLRSRGAVLRVAGPLPLVWGDRDRIGQLLANLIVNGIKYNKSSTPWVEVNANVEAGTDSPDFESDSNPNTEVTISIRDNGIGIETQFHATIFQLFRRLHTREEFEGTGAGLAICNKIVQAHGGRIWVESALGQGSTFFIRLKGGPPSASTNLSLNSASSSASHETAVLQVPGDEPNAR